MWPLLLLAAWLTAAVIVEYGKARPGPYTDLAAAEAARCIRTGADGIYRGQGGLSLESFCRHRGNVIAMDALCKAHPDKCLTPAE